MYYANTKITRIISTFDLQVVELASLASVESAVGRLQCVNSSIDMIQAQAKEARVTIHQYKDQGSNLIILCVCDYSIFFYLFFQ